MFYVGVSWCPVWMHICFIGMDNTNSIETNPQLRNNNVYLYLKHFLPVLYIYVNVIFIHLDFQSQ